jgi:viroplasmin and RNaseH domain-containing protein
MKIEILALLDIVSSLIKTDKAEKLKEQPIKGYLLQYADNNLIGQLQDELDNENYKQALELIDSYRVLCKELLTIYNAILHDYKDLQSNHIKKKVAAILNEKYGISKVDKVVELLSIKMDEAPHIILMPK